jgi:hypothetical protein
MSRRLPVLLMGLLLLAGACMSGSADGGRAKPDYTPVPDDELFSRVAAVPGVEKADLSFNGTWPEHSYLGEVDISPGADGQVVLDTIYAILRQGRFDAAMNIQGYQAGAAIRLEALQRAGTPSALTKRYGPQPGSGTPPAP